MNGHGKSDRSVVPTKSSNKAAQAAETMEGSDLTKGNSSQQSTLRTQSREGVYKAKSKAKGEQVTRKADLIAEIALSIGTSEELIESLEKATKETLELIAKAVKQ